jgi:hypothetical protein
MVEDTFDQYKDLGHLDLGFFVFATSFQQINRFIKDFHHIDAKYVLYAYSW